MQLRSMAQGCSEIESFTNYTRTKGFLRLFQVLLVFVIQQVSIYIASVVVPSGKK